MSSAALWPLTHGLLSLFTLFIRSGCLLLITEAPYEMTTCLTTFAADEFATIAD